jgi:uncharacterized protein (UPF0276 family)
LRTEHYGDVLQGRPSDVDWFEVISENFMDSGGRPLRILEAVRRDYEIALHGVGLSIGSADPLNATYLDSLSALSDRIEPALITDHLCWTGTAGRSLYDLLPVPYTPEILEYVFERVERVQERLGRRILLENASTYIEWSASQMPEWEFLSVLAERADCGILLDVNNVYVTCSNHGMDPEKYIDSIPVERVGQFHLAGFTDMGSYLFDTHSAAVCEEVWSLFRRAIGRFGDRSTLIEWDDDIPSLDRLREELSRARREAGGVSDET